MLPEPAKSAETTDTPVMSALMARRKSMRIRPPRHRVRWIALVVGLAMVAVVVVVATAPPVTQYEADSPLLGHRAPAIVGQTITGQSFDLGALRGQFVVIDFFSSWCVPCRTEQPELVTFAKGQLASQHGAVLVGVVFEDSVSAIRSLLGTWRGLYPVLIDPGGRFALDYGVDNPPSKYVIDPDGVVVAKIVGPVTATGLDAVIARAQDRAR